MNYDKIFKDEVLDILEKEYKINAETIEKNKESTDTFLKGALNG